MIQTSELKFERSSCRERLMCRRAERHCTHKHKTMAQMLRLKMWLQRTQYFQEGPISSSCKKHGNTFICLIQEIIIGLLLDFIQVKIESINCH